MPPFKFNQLYGFIGASVLALALGIGWYVERTNHKAYRSEVKAIAAVQEADNARKEASLADRLNELSEAHQQELQANNLDREKLRRRLNDEIKLNRTLNRTVNRLQNSRASAVPQIPINAEGCPTPEQDSNRTINTLTDAGRSCHADYKYLYESWQAVCHEYGCD